MTAATFGVRGPPQPQHSFFATGPVHFRATSAHALSTKAWLLMLKSKISACMQLIPVIPHFPDMLRSLTL